MDFKFCLLAGGRPPFPCSDRLIIYLRMRDDIIGAIFSNRDLEKPFHFEFLNSNIQVIRPHFKSSFWLFVDNNCIYIVPELQPLAPPRNTQTEATSFTMSMSTIVHVQKHGKQFSTFPKSQKIGRVIPVILLCNAGFFVKKK